MSITYQDIAKTQAIQFSQWHCAYKECSATIQGTVDEMFEILRDPDATANEKDHATDVIISALFPSLAEDVLASSRAVLEAPEMREAGKRLSAQESVFADNLRKLMEERGITQEQLAAMTGVSQPAISHILNRQCRPQQRTVLRFAEALQVNPEKLWPPLEPAQAVEPAEQAVGA